MPLSTTTQVVGAKEAIRSLRRIDPEIRRQFTRDAKQAVAPIIDEAVSKYPPEALSGMARKWKSGNRQLFPYDRTKAIRGLKLKVDTSRRSDSVIKLVQTNPAAAIFEVAGSAGGGSLGRNLNDRFGRASRLLWPIAERRLPEITDAVRDLVLTAVRRVNKEL
jgi:hypothetical protein